MNSPRVVLDDGGDQKWVRDGERELQGTKPVGKRPNKCGRMSVILKCGQLVEGRAMVAR
jgi:hypothetical protein